MVGEVPWTLQCVQGWGLGGGGGGGGGRDGGRRDGGRKGDDRGRRRRWWWRRRRSRGRGRGTSGALGTLGALDLGLDCGLGGVIACLLGSRGSAAMGLARMLAEEVPGRD
jgi:hypothetical protein